MKQLFEKGERKVEYVELIYDLIFVYLVSRNGSLLQITEDGFLTLPAYLTYLASSAAILQIWYLSTLYINQCGDGSLREHLMLFFNMYLLYYMADGIREDWGPVYFRYNGAWALILLNLALHFAIMGRRCGAGDESRRYLRRCALTLVIEAGIILVSIPIYSRTGIALAPWAVVFSVAVPLLTRDVERRLPADFPHLAERVMLYIVFTFGEMILGITGYFDDGFSLRTVYCSLMVFAVVVGLFSGYGHYYNHLMDENAKTTGSGYMLLHIVMILALNNITAALEFMQHPAVRPVPRTVFLVCSLLLFYVCLLGTQRYAKYRVENKARFYGGFAAGFALFCVAMALCCRRPLASLAITAAYIYVQLFLLHYGNKKA